MKKVLYLPYALNLNQNCSNFNSVFVDIVAITQTNSFNFLSLIKNLSKLVCRFFKPLSKLVNFILKAHASVQDYKINLKLKNFHHNDNI